MTRPTLEKYGAENGNWRYKRNKKRANEGKRWHSDVGNHSGKGRRRRRQRRGQVLYDYLLFECCFVLPDVWGWLHAWGRKEGKEDGGGDDETARILALFCLIFILSAPYSIGVDPPILFGTLSFCQGACPDNGNDVLGVSIGTPTVTINSKDICPDLQVNQAHSDRTLRCCWWWTTFSYRPSSNFPFPTCVLWNFPHRHLAYEYRIAHWRSCLSAATVIRRHYQTTSIQNFKPQGSSYQYKFFSSSEWFHSFNAKLVLF